MLGIWLGIFTFRVKIIDFNEMANINFRPNKGKSVKDTSKPQKIYIRYCIGRKVDFNASTNATVLIENWDFDKQRVKNRAHLTNRLEVNTLLTNLTKHFEEFESQNLRDGIIPSYQIVKSHFDSFYTAPDDKGKDQRLTFFAFVDKYIEDARTKPNPITKKPLSKNTLKDYVLTRNVLQQFSNEVKRFDFDDIDADWYDDFTKWCNKKGFKDNYKGKHIKTLKTFLNYALENNLTTNRNHQKRTFSVFKEETESIYLNLDELNTMWQMDLSNEPTKELARDLFLIGCFTGLRVSDYNNLKPTSIKVMDGVKMLVVKTQKTKKIVAIPMHPIVEAILTKYDGIPPRMFDQKINQNIKEIAEMAGIIEPVETTSTIGGLEVIKRHMKYELVTTHTARRSFCTNAYLTGTNSHDIMAISGHSTEKNFLKYIKVTPEQRAVKMSKAKFFNDTNHLKVV
jgi:site-specific recombinase XerD